MAAAFTARMVYLAQLSASEIGQVLPLDMVFYRDLAARMASSGALPPGPISFNPLYPVFLSVVFRLAGDALLTVRVIQSLLGVLDIWVVYLGAKMLARSLWGGSGRVEAAALLAAFLTAFYSQLPLYEGSLLGTTLVTVILTASFTLSMSIDRGLAQTSSQEGRARGRVPGWAKVSALGLLAGMGALGRPNLFLLLVLSLPLLLYLRAGRGRRGIRLALLCAAGSLVVLAPLVAYNAWKTGEFVPVSTHGGINFYIGNRHEATGIYEPPEGMRSDMRGLLEDARRIAGRESGREMSDAEASDFWIDQARTRIVTDPLGWLGLLGRKFVLFWNGKEVSDIVDYSIFSAECPALRVFFVPFALISALALPGLALLILLRKARAVTLVFAGASMASIMLFYINARYRVPAVPLLTCPAACFAVWTASKAGERDIRKAVAALVAFALVLFGISTRRMVEVDKSAAYTFLGNHYMQSGETAKGEKAFEEAYRLAPDLVMTKINLARVLIARGRLEDSERLYRSAWEKDPGFPMLAVEYGSLLDQLGRRERAVEMYEYALDLGRERDRLVACQLLSRIAYDRGDIDEAVRWIREAIEISPEDPRLNDLLRMLEDELE